MKQAEKEMDAGGDCLKSGFDHELFHASENVIDFRRIIWFKSS